MLNLLCSNFFLETEYRRSHITTDESKDAISVIINNQAFEIGEISELHARKLPVLICFT